MEAQAECTVIIPTLNNPQGAIDLVSDFYRLHDIDKFRIISVDQTRDGITFKDEEPVHLHIKPDHNLGFSKAMNTGWKLVQTPFTLLANDDIRLLDPRWYEDARVALGNQAIMGVNPFPATRTWDENGDVVWYWDQLNRDGTRDDRWDFIKDKPFEEYTPEDYDKLMKLHGGGVGPGTAMFFTMLRTEAREIIGYLDELYWNNCEDYDFNRRCYLTCWHCQRRKYDHYDGKKCYLKEVPFHPYNEITKEETEKWEDFEPYQLYTFKDALIHHQCGVTKEGVEAEGKDTTYDTIVNAKGVFHDKWNIKESNPNEIYGVGGTDKPSKPWWSEIPL